MLTDSFIFISFRSGAVWVPRVCVQMVAVGSVDDGAMREGEGEGDGGGEEEGRSAGSER